MTATLADAPTLDVAALYAEHHGTLVAYLRGRVGDAAEDVAQDVWVRVWRGQATYRAEAGTPRQWLFGIASHQVVDHWRASARRPATMDDPDLALERAADPVDVAGTEVDRALVEQLLDELPERQREVLRLRFLADQTVAQTAEVMAIPAGTVKSTCARALAALRTALGVVAPIRPSTTPPGGDPVDPAAISDPAPADDLAPRPGRPVGPHRRGPGYLPRQRAALAPLEGLLLGSAAAPDPGPPPTRPGPVTVRTRLVLLLAGFLAYLIAVLADALNARDRWIRAWRVGRIRDGSHWRTRRRFRAITSPIAAEMTALDRTLTNLHTTSEDTR